MAHGNDQKERSDAEHKLAKINLAEGVGFEPTIPERGYALSRRAH